MSKSDTVTHQSLDSPLSLTSSSNPQPNTTVTLDDGSPASLAVNVESASQDLQVGDSAPAPKDSSFSFTTSSIPQSNTTVTLDDGTAASLAVNIDSAR